MDMTEESVSTNSNYLMWAVIFGLFIAVVLSGCAGTKAEDYFIPRYELKEGMTRDSVVARLARDPRLLSDMHCSVNSEGYDTCQIEEPRPNGQYGYRTVAWVTFDQRDRVVGFQARERR